MSNSVLLDLTLADDLAAEYKAYLPSESDIVTWVQTTLQHIAYHKDIEINVRVVSLQESQNLNNTYRGKNKATNVLSFESDLPDFVPSNFRGDLAICANIVQAEALEQNKAIAHHWTHMCIHGVLHLLGYDHIDEQDADEMEALEKAVLAKLGIDDPYQLS